MPSGLIRLSVGVLLIAWGLIPVYVFVCVASKGFWTELLGVGDFYFELAVQVVEACLVMQERTGGLTLFEAIRSRIARQRGRGAIQITEYPHIHTCRLHLIVRLVRILFEQSKR